MADPSIPEQRTHGLQTLDKLTRFASEDLARGINRRSFLRQAGTGAFTFMIALATGKMLTPRSAAAASGTKPPVSPNISCAPPGPYCNTGGGDLSGCRGAHCFQHLSSGQIRQCRVYYTFYSAGCWTTASGGGYWTCCDCQCDGGATCGCAQFSTAPVPSPSGPVG